MHFQDRHTHFYGTFAFSDIFFDKLNVKVDIQGWKTYQLLFGGR